jgi:hypothetical protein
MTAIVTDSFRKKVVNLLFDEVTNATDSDQYYIGIGKSDAYDSSDTVVNPVRTIREERLARENLQSIKIVNATSFVVTRHNWSTSTIYPAYSDSQAGNSSPAHYVLTDDNDVYIVIQQSKNAAGIAQPSTIKPSYNDAGVAKTKPFQTSDGYIWKYLYTVDATSANNFLSSGFVPIQFSPLVDSSSDTSLSDAKRFQAEVRENAVSGAITGALKVSGGSGYTSAPTVTVNGTGRTARLVATVSAGEVVKVELDSAEAGGTGYDLAEIVFTGGGGSGADYRPIITTQKGIGYDPRDDLRSSSIMFNAKPAGTEGGNFITDQDFRQIVLMKNLEVGDSASGQPTPIFGSTSGIALRSLKLNGVSAATFTVDNKIVGGSSGATAFIDGITDSSVFYHQTEATGFKSFSDGETATETGGSGTGTVDSAAPNYTIDKFSGEVLYIENRAAVTRSSSQTEDIKVIITI